MQVEGAACTGLARLNLSDNMVRGGSLQSVLLAALPDRLARAGRPDPGAQFGRSEPHLRGTIGAAEAQRGYLLDKIPLARFRIRQMLLELFDLVMCLISFQRSPDI